MPIGEMTVAISSLVGLLSGLYIATVSAVIFNFFLIPNLERRLGHKLKYDLMYTYIVLSKWVGPQSEISFYIVTRYFAKIFKGERGLPKKMNRFVLKKAGFTIDMATRFELVMSFFMAFKFFSNYYFVRDCNFTE